MQNRMILRFKPPFLLFSCQVLFKRIAEATGESLESVFKMQEAERNELVEVLGLKREEDQKEESKVENQPPHQVIPVHLRQEGPMQNGQMERAIPPATIEGPGAVRGVIQHFGFGGQGGQGQGGGQGGQGGYRGQVVGPQYPSTEYGARLLVQDTRLSNYSLTCELCQKKTKTIQSLVTHVIVHFRVELERKVKDLMEFSELEGFQCKACDKTFKCKTPLIAHIGYKHDMLNDVLREKGFSVLPCLL